MNHVSDFAAAHAPAPDSSRKRRQILDAARALFMADGYEKVSMDHVARTAQVSKATLYAHFASKDVLFATMVADGCFTSTIGSDRFETMPDDMRAALTELGELLLRFLLEDRIQAIYRVAVAEARRFPEMGRAFYDNGPGAFLRELAGWLERQTEAGRLAVPVPLVAAEQFCALVRSGLFMTCTLGLGPAPSDAQIAASVASAVDMFLRSYGREG